MATLMRGLKRTLGHEPTISYDDLLNSYCSNDRLILDDVGMGGSGSEWEYGQLEEIVVARYRERLFTIITTNRDLKELPERIVSRFSDPNVGRVILNTGKDYRIVRNGNGR